MGGAAPHPFFKEKPWGRGWVLTSPDIFKNRDFFPPFYFPSIRKRRFRVPKTWVLERSPEWSFCKRRFIVFVWTDVNEGFWMRWCHTSDSECPERYAIVCPSFPRFHVDGQNRIELATFERVFFEEKRKKILRFQKYPHTFGDPAVKSLLFDRGTLRCLGVYKFSREEAPPPPSGSDA